MKHFISRFLMADCLPANIIFKPILLLGLRLYIAQVFFVSGLLKLQSWASTLALFQYEYQVPWLSVTASAYLTTSIELVLPILIAIGLLTRIASPLLILFLVAATLFYPDIRGVDIQEHLVWGLILFIVFIFGPGSLSLDAMLSRRLLSQDKS